MHGSLNSDEIELLRRLPVISRAREHRLYGVDGTRWVDCWADGGRILEGHRPGGLSKRIKNEIDRGLYAPYPSHWETRLEKALMKTFPGYTGVRFYSSTRAALEKLATDKDREGGLIPVDPLDLPVPATATVGTHRILWGRPLLPDHPVADYLLPVMPLSGLTEVQPVLFTLGNQPKYHSEIISPIVLAGLTRVIQPGLRGKLPITTESSDIWERRGPYMCFRGEESDYPKLFDKMFSQNIIIAPSACRPSIFPARANERESVLILSGGKG